MFLCGCQPPLQDVVETFLEAVAKRDIPTAANFLAPELKQAITNVPIARHEYLYKIKRITWQVNNIYAEQRGLACAAVVTITWKGSAAASQDILLLMDLKRLPPHNLWFISAITVQAQIQQRMIHEPLPDFIRHINDSI